MSHVSVERNRRRQMNDRLKVLRSLTPSFYIKKGDQASVLGGVIDFMKELHQVLQSLESQKRRKTTSRRLSIPSPTPSPRLSLQPSPCQSSSNNNAAALTSYQFLDPAPAPAAAAVNNNNNKKTKELAACCNSCLADVEAKISGSNVILRTVSQRVPGQLVKIISLLERRDFEILHLNISSMEDTVLYSFVVEIGLDCQLTMEELVSEVQQTFSMHTPHIKRTNSKAPFG